MGLSDCADPIDGDNSAIGSRRRACLYAVVQKAPESGKVDRPRVERVAIRCHTWGFPLFKRRKLLVDRPDLFLAYSVFILNYLLQTNINGI